MQFECKLDCHRDKYIIESECFNGNKIDYFVMNQNRFVLVGTLAWCFCVQKTFFGVVKKINNLLDSLLHNSNIYRS